MAQWERGGGGGAPQTCNPTIGLWRCRQRSDREKGEAVLPAAVEDAALVCWVKLSLPGRQTLTQSPFCSLWVAVLTGPDGEQPTARVKKPTSRPELKPYQSLKAIFCLFC